MVFARQFLNNESKIYSTEQDILESQEHLRQMKAITVKNDEMYGMLLLAFPQFKTSRTTFVTSFN